MPFFANNTLSTRDLTMLQSHVNNVNSSYELTQEQLDTAGFSGNLNETIDSLVNNITGTVDEPDTIGDQSLFISEYYEGSRYNKYIEIFNPTDSEISLDDYALPYVHSSPTTVGKYEKWLPFTSGATISSKGFYIIASTEAESSILSKANQTIGYQSFFNGDDGLKLVKKIGNTYNFHNGAIEDVDFEVVDTLGDWQGDPGEGWDVAGLSEATKDSTLIRKPSITKGNTDWDASRGTNRFNSEWIVKEVSSDNLKIHTIFDTSYIPEPEPEPEAEPEPEPVVWNYFGQQSTVLLESDTDNSIWFYKNGMVQFLNEHPDININQYNIWNTSTIANEIQDYWLLEIEDRNSDGTGNGNFSAYKLFNINSGLSRTYVYFSTQPEFVPAGSNRYATVRFWTTRDIPDDRPPAPGPAPEPPSEEPQADPNVTFRDSNNTVLGSVGVNGDLTSDSYDGITKTDIVSVEITGTDVTSIRNNAFDTCTNLTSITLPTSLVNIGHEAFSVCSNLTSITIPDSVTNIGVNVFQFCSSLATVYMSATVATALDVSFGVQSYKGSPNTTEIINPNANVFFRDSNSDILHRAEVNDTLESVAMDRDSVYSVEITGSNVTGIGGSVFFGYSNLTSFTIPDSVTSINSQAFYNSGLTSITIPDTVTTIGTQCFGHCSSLVSVTIGSSVTSISDFVFQNCVKLSSVTMGNSVTTIGEGAFQSCSKITSITLSDAITSLGKRAFQSTGITSFTIPNTVTTIGIQCFKNTGLTSITIGNSVETISNEIFEGCSELTQITLPNSVTSISNTAFSGSSLSTIYMSSTLATALGVSFGKQSYNGSPSSTEITNVNANVFFRDSNSDILHRAEVTGELGSTSYSSDISANDIVSIDISGSNVTSLGTYAFKECTSLTTITIPDSVTSIGYGAFQQCSSLASVTIGDSVTSIGTNAFQECSSLASVTIPNSVETIGFGAFEACSNLASVTIPNSITSIGNQAFYKCGALLSVSIPNSVTSIGTNTFSDCYLLNSVTIGTSVESIGNSAFFKCAITNITIPDSVKSIGEDAFRACGSLTSISLPNNSEFTTISNNIFRDCSVLASITIPNSVTDVGSYVFIACAELTSVTFSTSTINIGSTLFSGCSKLATVYMSATTVTALDISFGVQTFSSSPNQIEIINVNANVIFRDSNDDILHRAEVNEELGATSYHGITRDDIVSVEITGSNVTSIGNNAFYSCRGLTSITIPDSVTSIGDEVFYWCIKLASITLGNSVQTIGKFAFRNNPTITEITIPDSVTSIGQNAFMLCANLTTIYMSNTTRSNLGITSFGVQSYEGSPDTTEIVNSDANVIFRDSNGDVLHRAEVNGNLHTGSYYGTDGLLLTKSDVATIEITGSNVTSIGVTYSYNGTFYRFTNLTSITIPNSVTSIGNSVFQQCSNLTSITIPDSVTSMGQYVFYNCAKLASVTIGNSVTSIGDYAFSYCPQLATIYMSDTTRSDLEIDSFGEQSYKSSPDTTEIVQI